MIVKIIRKIYDFEIIFTANFNNFINILFFKKLTNYNFDFIFLFKIEIF